MERFIAYNNIFFRNKMDAERPIVSPLGMFMEGQQTRFRKFQKKKKMKSWFMASLKYGLKMKEKLSKTFPGRELLT